MKPIQKKLRFKLYKRLLKIYKKKVCSDTFDSSMGMCWNLTCLLKQKGHENYEVYYNLGILFPELKKEKIATDPDDWWNNKEERITALENIIKNDTNKVRQTNSN